MHEIALSSQAAWWSFFKLRRVVSVAARRSTALVLTRNALSLPVSSGVPGLRAGWCKACTLDWLSLVMNSFSSLPDGGDFGEGRDGEIGLE